VAGVLLAVVGTGLVGLGGYVALRPPKSPGGHAGGLGLGARSVGAGLPIIALGALALVVATAGPPIVPPSVLEVLGRPTPGGPSPGGTAAGVQPTPSPPAPSPAPASPSPSPSPGQPSPSACFTSLFAGTPSNRVVQVTIDQPRLWQLGPVVSDPSQLGGLYGVILISSGRTIGALRLSYDVRAQQYTIEMVVDASCAAVGVNGAARATQGLGDPVVLKVGGATFSVAVIAASSLELRAG
jgi:hypothetical protein